ncbi:WD repeat-containing protein 46 [Thrips palmi]|uniref:WD repeat-containing protein 46 n=1 Tax=Thrips palmi TaxID=161013 RepID=A0A6P8ZVH1_THRPL|nr:WD repeat-containing protein 46 [Thrips palmi]XP_034249130.1 WD repeat-containing protein 46 [Thrips palmi]XP_034249131.1 WD repeat-containing protein 46 [Thrips palmi]
MGKTKPTPDHTTKAVEANLKPAKRKQWVKKRDEQLKDFVSLADTAGFKGRKGKAGKVKDEGENNELPKSLRNSKGGKASGRTPVPKEKLLKYSRGDGMDGSGVKKNVLKAKLERREKAIEFSTEQAARLEILLPEDTGYLEADDGEVTRQFDQSQIADSVDITSASKQFDLDLQFGPYRSNYSRNGRYLAIGGRRGHIATMDWVTKKLMCEINVMEEVVDVRWLHVETMLAVAQKEWVYIYDNQGIELHCLKQLNRALRMEFLPYHFLLSTAGENGWLKWLDISVGKIISQFNTRMGRLNLMVQNPYNAILCLGHAQGTVTMWSPNVKEPLAKMLCHRSPLLGLDVDRTGQYMVTSAADKTVKTWDLRMMSGPLTEYHLYGHANNLAFSEKGLVALSMGNIVEVYKDPCRNSVEKAYLRHKSNGSVTGLQFSPYEDVLGVAHARGFSSVLVPGSGEPNFDALEANPYQTKSQRREAEVKSLLEKIQPELITLDPNTIAQVDVPTLQDKVEAKKSILFLKPPKLDFEPRKRAKWRSGTAFAAKSKKIVREDNVRKFVQTKSKLLMEENSKKKQSNNESRNVLDRFRPKK